MLAVVLQAVGFLVQVLSLVENFRGSSMTSSHSYWSTVVDYVNKRSLASTNDPGKYTTLVVGHSLGGGLAKIVGCKTDLQAVAFSGPGLFYTR